MGVAPGIVLGMEEKLRAPDPLTCTHDEWERYVSVVDVFAMTSTQAAAHREALATYGRRLARESTQMHETSVRLVEQRDRTYADAEDLSDRCRRLQDQVLQQGDVMLELHRRHGPQDERVVDARAERDRLMELLAGARRELMVANEQAATAFQDAR